MDNNECLLEDAQIQATNGCIEEFPDGMEEESGDIMSGAIELEKGIFGGGEGGGGTPVTFHNHFFNQKEIDDYSCFYVSHYTALANMYNVDIPLSVIKEGWQELIACGYFTPGRGGYASNGAEIATKHFNKFTGKNVKHKVVPFNIKNIVAAQKKGSNFVF